MRLVPRLPQVAMLVPGELDSLAAVRRALASALDQHGWDQESRLGVLLAACEALTNAIEHGSQPTGRVTVDFRIDRWRALLRIVDEGRPGAVAPSATRPVPPTSAPRGRGIVIMGALADRLELRPAGAGTEVTMHFRRPLAAAA